MITANVYSEDPLDRVERGLIGDGLDLIGQYVGGITVVGTSLVQFCPETLSSGCPDPEKFDYSLLDPYTHLHLFFASFRVESMPRSQSFVGFSEYGSGTAWVDNLARDFLVPSVVSHEVAHSLRFLLEQDDDESKEDEGHCADEECIMAQNINTNHLEIKVADYIEKIAPNFRKRISFGDPVNYQEDFCDSCTDELETHSDEHVGFLECGRIETGVVEATDTVSRSFE
jgi:hypothetical protein